MFCFWSSPDGGDGIAMTMTSAAMLLLCHVTLVHVVNPICCLVTRLLYSRGIKLAVFSHQTIYYCIKDCFLNIT